MIFKELWGIRLALAVGYIFSLDISHADEMDHLTQEIEGLKARIEQLEQQQGENTDGEVHKLHPIHSLSGAKLSGGDTRFGDRESNYRVYAWERQTPHCTNSADPALFLNCELIDPAQRSFIKGRNRGVGANFDQSLSTSTGIWARFGIQNPDVAQFGKALNAGLVTAIAEGKRLHDVLRPAYGAAFPGDAYKSATGYSDTEHYAEICYKFVLSGDGSTNRRPII